MSANRRVEDTCDIQSSVGKWSCACAGDVAISKTLGHGGGGPGLKSKWSSSRSVVEACFCSLPASGRGAEVEARRVARSAGDSSLK